MAKKTLHATIQGNIFSMLGLEEMSDERKLRLLEDASALVEKRVMVKFLESLTDADMDEVDKADDAEKFFALMLRKMPNLEQVAEGEAMKVKDELLAIVAE